MKNRFFPFPLMWGEKTLYINSIISPLQKWPTRFTMRERLESLAFPRIRTVNPSDYLLKSQEFFYNDQFRYKNEAADIDGANEESPYRQRASRLL